MIGYVMKNSKGEYLSMDGGSTSDWFQASKFDDSGIKHREIYLQCGYELFQFEVPELNKVLVCQCGNYCSSDFNLIMKEDGFYKVCSHCKEDIHIINEKGDVLKWM